MSRRSPLVAAPLPGYGRGAAGAGGDEAGARPCPRCAARHGSRLPPRPAPGSPTGARRGAGRNGRGGERKPVDRAKARTLALGVRRLAL